MNFELLDSNPATNQKPETRNQKRSALFLVSGFWFLVCLVLFPVVTPLSAQEPHFAVTGYVAAREVKATGPESWLANGFGRLDAGGERQRRFLVSQLGVDWRPSQFFDVHVSGAGRRDPDGYEGRAAGVVEAYADVRAIFGNDQLQLRAGEFFLPTSRENKDVLWQSPYTISFSALNTWIGEEVRPVGADLEWRHTLASGHQITAAATAFRGNDSMGALLAWRGWTAGSRLTTYSEVLPLPPVSTIPEYFPAQRSDGTRPIGSDLDGNNGYAARLRYSVPQRGNVQYTWLDNRGDRALHDGEYAWATRFHMVSAELGNPDDLVIAAEYVSGTTGMGVPPAFVDAGFHAAYALLSEKQGRHRWTARYDVFDTKEKDFSIAESNAEEGHSWTFAWLYDFRANLRAGAELTEIRAKRPALQEDGIDPRVDGRNVTLELRYHF